MSQKSTGSHTQAIADLLQAQGLKTVVAVVHQTCDSRLSEFLIGTVFDVHRIYVEAGTADGGEPSFSDGHSIEAALADIEGSIDLLYLDGWPVGSEDYKAHHLAVFQAAAPKLHEKSFVLIQQTDVDHGGKASDVLPAALTTGFRVIQWGPRSLLSRQSAEAFAGRLPRVGPPVPGEASFNDAVQLHQQGFNWEAECIYRSILEQSPDHASALHLLGVIMHQRGEHDQALALIGRAIAQDPTQSVQFNNYGAALQELGRHVEALACFQMALNLRPQNSDAMSNLGMAQESLGQDERALASYRQALELNSAHRDACTRLAALLRKRGKIAEAKRVLTRAIKAQPTAELHVQLGNLLVSGGDLDTAVTNYESALKLQPDCAAAYFNIGNVDHEQHRVEKARQQFRHAAELNPQKPFWRLREHAISPAVFQSNGEIDQFRHQLSSELDTWVQHPPPASWDDLLSAGAFPNFSYAYHGRNNRALKEKFASLYEHYFHDQPAARGSGLADRIRVGFVVTVRHEGIFLRCMKGIVNELDPQQFEVLLLCSHAASEPLKKQIPRGDIRFVHFGGQRLDEAAKVIRDARCDVLYFWEIGSDSLNYLLPFLRLAPVQCTSHGSQITSGIPAVDYFFTSELIETKTAQPAGGMTAQPAGEQTAQQNYTEMIWKSRSLLMNQPRLPAPSPVGRHHFGLPDDCNLYACLQNPLKIHPDMDAMISGILRSDPAAQLVLLRGPSEDAANRLRERFRETIGGPADRIRFLPWQPFDDYCRLLAAADVVLDPPQFGAGSTAYDIFSFNQPVVSLPGRLNVGRVVDGCYRKMGLTELVPKSLSEYVAMATRLGTDRDYRLHLRNRVAAHSGVLFNDREAVTEHERFFREISGKVTPNAL